jgi:hypothetical protein
MHDINLFIQRIYIHVRRHVYLIEDTQEIPDGTQYLTFNFS